jgi:Ser/Thr protein kinase RdoA (MazF antagonist)
LPESPEEHARKVIARFYGINAVTIQPIAHGLINWLARVDVDGQVYALKRYNPRYFTPELVERSVSAQHHCLTHGVPAPAIVPNQDGQLITWAGDAAYVLSDFVEGRHLSPGQFSPTAAHSLGETVGRVVLALADNWQELREPWTLRPVDEVVEQFERLRHAAESGTNELDRRVALDMRFRLGYLQRHPDLYARVSAMPMQWVHADILDTNVIVGPNDQVSALLDFDNVTVLPRAFDFMWALTFCIGPLAPERDDYLCGFRDLVRPSSGELASYVPFWTYQAVCVAWPLEWRYLEPERFDPRWEKACWEAFLPAQWEADWENVARWLASI